MNYHHMYVYVKCYESQKKLLSVSVGKYKICCLYMMAHGSVTKIVCDDKFNPRRFPLENRQNMFAYGPTSASV